MYTYEPRTFSLPTLDGISNESIQEHLDLYRGYVNTFNAISTLISDLAKDSEKNAHALSELIRRRSFEFDGMRLHELYFTQFEQGPHPLDTTSSLQNAIETEYGSLETCVRALSAIALMRGPGWALLYRDPQSGSLLTSFSGEQHQGHFVTLPVLLAIDVWEHAYLKDYGALGKKGYVAAFFNNLNWQVVEKRFAEAVK